MKISRTKKNRKNPKRLIAGILAAAMAVVAVVGTGTVGKITATASTISDNDDGTYNNPVIYSDVPDPDVICVDGNYYMISTTMHMSPGCPIMKSTDLVNWEIVNYCYDILDDSDESSLRNDEDDYGNGSWAASLRYNDGKYYVAVGSLSKGKTYIFVTDDIENGTWTRSELDTYYHDLSLLFDDGNIYLFYGSGSLNVIELEEDEEGNITCKEDGLNTTLIADANIDFDAGGLEAEGAHAYKIGNYYYVFMIQWASDRVREQICWRSTSLEGEWEGEIVLNSGLYYDETEDGAGVAQGGILQSENGNWYSIMFQDHSSVGRIPVLTTVTWEDEWPVFTEPDSVMDITAGESSDSVSGIVVSDEFDNGSTRQAYTLNQADASQTEDQEDSSDADNDTPFSGLLVGASSLISLLSVQSTADSENLLTDGGFETGTAGDWVSHEYATVEVTDEEASTGTYSLKVTNRTATAAGPEMDVTGLLEAGKTYQISFSVMYNGEDTTESRDFVLTCSDGDWTTYTNMISGTVTKGEWTTITGTYTMPDSYKNDTQTIFLETTWTADPTAENDLMDYYLDDVVITEIVLDEVEEGENDYNGSNLGLEWQWNHNPNNNYWSLTEREGYLRLTTGSLADNILDARNTLTQRTYGPTSSAEVAIEVSGMKDGDVTGLSAFQQIYGFVGVKMEDGKKYIVMQMAEDENDEDGKEIERVELTEDRVYLRVDCDFTQRTDKAYFYYSLDGETWTQIGDVLQMSYTMPHFMGYRFALFNYATETVGGYVDFDYFHVSDEM